MRFDLLSSSVSPPMFTPCLQTDEVRADSCPGTGAIRRFPIVLKLQTATVKSFDSDIACWIHNRFGLRRYGSLYLYERESIFHRISHLHVPNRFRQGKCVTRRGNRGTWCDQHQSADVADKRGIFRDQLPGKTGQHGEPDQVNLTSGRISDRGTAGVPGLGTNRPFRRFLN